jgi:photosystem II stability/assembly factor-like uncharacterized protein
MNARFVFLMVVYLCALALLELAPMSAKCQWNLLTTPPGGFVNAGSPCVDSSHNLYISASGDEVFHKRNFTSGLWSALRVDSAHPTSLPSTSICLPNGMIVVANRNNLFWSSDGGAYWTKEWTSPATVAQLAITPDGLLLAATNHGIFRTDTTDTLWTRLDSSFSVTSFRSVFAAPNGHYFAASQAHLYRSTDRGATWTEPDPNLIDPDASAGPIVATYLVNAHGILLAGGFGNVYASSDDGNTWTATNAVFGRVTVTSLCKGTDGTLYATTYWPGVEGNNPVVLPPAGTWRSTDDGMSWYPMPSLWGYRAVAALNVARGLLAGITNEGIFESSDRGHHWIPVDSGFSIANVQDLAYTNNAVYTALGTRGIIRTSDGGAAWQRVNDSLIDDSYILLHRGNQLFAQGTATIFQWDGSSWHPLPQSDQSEITSATLDTNGQLFAGSINYGLWILPNGSDSWTTAQELSNVTVKSIVCDSSNVLYVLAGDSIYSSNDDGTSWSILPITGKDTSISTLAANNDTICVATVKTLYRSTDRGATWAAQPFGQKLAPQGLAFDGGITFAYTLSKVMETEGDNSEWQTDTGYSGFITSMTVAPNDTAYLGTTAMGIFARPVPPFASSSVASYSSIENDIALYPNPTHGTFEMTELPDEPMQVTIISEGGVTLSQTNVLPNNGSVMVALPESLVPGVYLCKIIGVRIGVFHRTVKFTLQR